MSSMRHAPRRRDLVWIAIPLVILLFLFSLGRAATLFEESPTLARVVEGIMIPACALLVVRAGGRKKCGMRNAECGMQKGESGRGPGVWGWWMVFTGMAVGACWAGVPTEGLEAVFLIYFAGRALGAVMGRGGWGGRWHGKQKSARTEKQGNWRAEGPVRQAAPHESGVKPPQSKIKEGRGAGLDYFRLTKPALVAMVLVAVLMGFYLASPGPQAGVRLAWTMAGVALLAGGAATFNQVLERRYDRRMPRTARRPLAAGRLAPRPAIRFGAALTLGGMAVLAGRVNLTTAFLATFSFAVYLFLYTGMKRTSPLATLVGAVSGALPPLLGWFGAGGALTPAALVMFGILYLWQIPHFLAIVWKYREEYRAAGFPLYGVLDPSGHATGLQALLYAVALLPVSLLMTWHGVTGLPYLFGAFTLGVVFAGYSLAFALRPAPGTTRRLFIASIAYLPCLYLAMMLERWW